ncbi:MAG: hypothetical protein J3K34DRAFT_473188 [Monoraphidium minutum]|nr:MAG: hypothetical protein J3K34DRAFT_473188 [Monoraphidium minutum]
MSSHGAPASATAASAAAGDGPVLAGFSFVNKTALNTLAQRTDATHLAAIAAERARLWAP